jgi:nucleosome binding factor SPN SPT16 subunit
MPFRNLGFNGVHARSNVYLQPTTDCLVSLTETPFLVITLADVEIAHLERVQVFNSTYSFSRNLVWIEKFRSSYDFQGLSSDPNSHQLYPHGTSRQCQNLARVPPRNLVYVLTESSCDIAFSEGQLNLNWTTIMKTVNDDSAEFFKEGGWSFLEAESDASDNESEEGSVFEMSEDAFEEESDEEEESDYDEDASDDEGSEMDVDESGDDWSELEEEGMFQSTDVANFQLQRLIRGRLMGAMNVLLSEESRKIACS